MRPSRATTRIGRVKAGTRAAPGLVSSCSARRCAALLALLCSLCSALRLHCCSPARLRCAALPDAVATTSRLSTPLFTPAPRIPSPATLLPRLRRLQAAIHRLSLSCLSPSSSPLLSPLSLSLSLSSLSRPSPSSSSVPHRLSSPRCRRPSVVVSRHAPLLVRPILSAALAAFRSSTFLPRTPPPAARRHACYRYRLAAKLRPPHDGPVAGLVSRCAPSVSRPRSTWTLPAPPSASQALSTPWLRPPILTPASTSTRSTRFAARCRARPLSPPASACAPRATRSLPRPSHRPPPPSRLWLSRAPSRPSPAATPVPPAHTPSPLSPARPRPSPLLATETTTTPSPTTT